MISFAYFHNYIHYYFSKLRKSYFLCISHLKCIILYRERVLVTKSKVEEMVVAHLQPSKVYMFRVVANNSRGPGLTSQVLLYSTV